MQLKRRRRNRNISLKKYRDRKFIKEETDHDSFMNYHLDDDNPSMHPLAILTYSDYKLLKENIIVLDQPIIEESNSLNRKIYYSIKSMGKNIRMKTDEESMVIKLREMKKRFFMIVIEKKNLNIIKQVSIIHYDQQTNMTDSYRRKSEKYLILMMCGDFSSNTYDDKKNITTQDIVDTTKVIPNQINKDKHFGSGGKVFSTGYSAKYKVIDGKSFDTFVKSK